MEGRGWGGEKPVNGNYELTDLFTPTVGTLHGVSLSQCQPDVCVCKWQG